MFHLVGEGVLVDVEGRYFAVVQYRASHHVPRTSPPHDHAELLACRLELIRRAADQAGEMCVGFHIKSRTEPRDPQYLESALLYDVELLQGEWPVSAPLAHWEQLGHGNAWIEMVARQELAV